MNEIAAGIGYSSYAKLLDRLRYLASREVFYSADTETARAEIASIGRQLHELDMLLMVYVINDIQPGRRGPLPQWRRLSDAASDNYTAHQIEEVWDKIGRFRRASFYWD